MSVNDEGAFSASQNQKLERVNANSACFRWKLREFSNIDESPNLCLPSKEFGATGCGVDWMVQVYPNGRKKKTINDFIAVGVQYLTELKGVIANIEVSILNNVGEVVKDCKWKDQNVKLIHYASNSKYVNVAMHRFNLRRSDVQNPRNCILKDDCLTISLDVTYSDPLVVPAISTKKEVETWQEERLKEFGKLLENDEFSDVTITVGDKEIRAHKAILAMHSPVFKSKFLQKQEKNIKIDDIEYAVLMELFRFMYTGEVGDIEKVADGLLVAAEKYCVERLKLLCEKALLGNVKIENAVHCLAAADASNRAILKKEAYDFFLDHADEIVERDDFTSLSPDLMRELFRGILKKFQIKGTD